MEVQESFLVCRNQLPTCGDLSLIARECLSESQRMEISKAIVYKSLNNVLRIVQKFWTAQLEFIVTMLINFSHISYPKFCRWGGKQ